MLPHYLDKLDGHSQEVFKKLKPFANTYVLAGGTALMLQIGHRLSYDFDLFAPDDLSPALSQTMKTIFPSIFILNETDEVITFKVQDTIDVTFVRYPYKPLKPALRTDSLRIFQLDDLAADKTYTIGRRGQWRDYVDLFFLLKLGLYDVAKLVGLANQKYGGEFNEKLFLGQLVYFDDVTIVPTTFIKTSYSDDEIKSFLESQVESYTAKILS